MDAKIRKTVKPQLSKDLEAAECLGMSYDNYIALLKDIEAAACLGMSYGHYKAYQRSLAKKRKARAKKERTK